MGQAPLTPLVALGLFTDQALVVPGRDKGQRKVTQEECGAVTFCFVALQGLLPFCFAYPYKSCYGLTPNPQNFKAISNILY